MTEVAELVAGPEGDALIAVKVIGWRICDHTDVGDGEWWCDDDEVRYWPVDNQFTTDIAAAWQVVEHLITQGWLWQVDISGDATRYWRAVIDHPSGPVETSHADTAPLAICRAALAAVGH